MVVVGNVVDFAGVIVCVASVAAAVVVDADFTAEVIVVFITGLVFAVEEDEREEKGAAVVLGVVLFTADLLGVVAVVVITFASVAFV